MIRPSVSKEFVLSERLEHLKWIFDDFIFIMGLNQGNQCGQLLGRLLNKGYICILLRILSLELTMHRLVNLHYICKLHRHEQNLKFISLSFSRFLKDTAIDEWANFSNL